MSMLLPVAPMRDPALPVLTADSTVGQLASPVRELPCTTPVSTVDELFRRDPLLHSLAVQCADGPGLLTRTGFQQLLIGPMGYGRAVHERRSLQELVDRDALVLSAGTTLSLAAQLLLDRPLQYRYDDVLVCGPDALGVLTVSAVFERLAGHFAHQSLHDPLTGLPNRLLLAESVRRLPAVATGSVTSAALLYVDLDGFKAVNDDFGHEVGDEVLIQCAQRLRAAVRPDDVVARLGGDEFALLLVETVTDEQACAIADRIVLSTAAPFLVADRVVLIGASVGIARAADQAEQCVDTVEALLRSADMAMYRAKTRGRGRVERFHSPQTEDWAAVRHRNSRDVERRLRATLQRGSLSLAYQPKYDLRTGLLLELEALARWDDDAGPVSPAVFIPVAERSGLIHELGRWALHTACEQATGWRRVGADGVDRGAAVAVNVSPHQLADTTFVAGVAEVLHRTGLPAARLCLEVTETSAIQDLAATREQLRQLKALGVLIALDDFGTGHSTLTLLRALPLDWVKIDRSFVEDVAESPAGAALVRLVIEAAHTLGLLVCAEGVERPEQLTALSAMGCDAVQGFLLGVPARVPQLRSAYRLNRFPNSPTSRATLPAARLPSGRCAP